MDTNPVDFTAMILKKFDNLGDQVNRLGNGITQLSAESGNVVKMLSRLETAVEKLEARDDAQQKAIDDVRLNLHRTDAALTGVSTTAQQAMTLAQRHEIVAQSSVEDREQLHKEMDQHKARLDVADAWRVEWGPWLKSFKWIAIGIASAALLVVAAWLLKDVALSIVIP